MELFGFIIAVILLFLVSSGWLFMLLFDGAYGGAGREIPMWIMVGLLCLIVALWVQVLKVAPFTVVTL